MFDCKRKGEGMQGNVLRSRNKTKVLDVDKKDEVEQIKQAHKTDQNQDTSAVKQSWQQQQPRQAYRMQTIRSQATEQLRSEQRTR